MKDKKEKILYQDVVDDPASEIELVCTESYNGMFQVGPGQFVPYSYREGDIKKRKEIFLNPRNWKLA